MERRNNPKKSKVSIELVTVPVYRVYNRNGKGTNYISAFAALTKYCRAKMIERYPLAMARNYGDAPVQVMDWKRRNWIEYRFARRYSRKMREYARYI